jgi:hypothetical protein
MHTGRLVRGQICWKASVRQKAGLERRLGGTSTRSGATTAPRYVRCISKAPYADNNQSGHLGDVSESAALVRPSADDTAGLSTPEGISGKTLLPLGFLALDGISWSILFADPLAEAHGSDTSPCSLG